MSQRRAVRDRWYAQVVKTKAINGACRTLLMHVAACHMDPSGRIGHLDETTSRFRGVRHEQLADELGWGKTQRISERYAEAIKAGLLRRSSGGYNGCPTVYDAQLLPAEGTQPLGTFRPLKVPSHWGSSDGKVPGEQVPAGWGPSDGATGAEGPQPLGHIRARVTERESPTTPAPLRDPRAVAGGAALPPGPPGGPPRSAAAAERQEEDQGSSLSLPERSGGRGGVGGAEPPTHSATTDRDVEPGDQLPAPADGRAHHRGLEVGDGTGDDFADLIAGTEEQFDAAIEEARAGGDLSRENLVAKLRQLVDRDGPPTCPNPPTPQEGPMTATKTRKTAPTPVPMGAAEWRRAVLGSDLPRAVRIIACQLAHFAITDDATVIRPPAVHVLGECAELPARDVLDALTTLRRTGWTVTVPDPDHDDDRPITGLVDPRRGAR